MPATAPYAELAVMATGGTNYGEASAVGVSTSTFFPPATEVGLGWDAQTEDRTDEIRGTLEPLSPDVVGQNIQTGPWNMRLYPNLLGLALFLCLGPPTSTAGDGIITAPDATVIPTGATRHVWDSATLSGLIRMARLRRGYPSPVGAFLRSYGVTVPEININAGDVNAFSTMQASLSALFSEVISDPSLTVSTDAPQVLPFKYGQHTVQTWLAASAIPTGLTWTISNPVEPYKDMGVTSNFYTTFDRPNDAGSAAPRISGSVVKKYLDTDDIAAMLAGTEFTVKSQWIHSVTIAASGYPYKLFIEGTGKYTGYEQDSVQNRPRAGATIPFSLGKPGSGSGSAFKITLVNAIASGGYSSVS
jgi:hypothetical protein